MLDVIIRGGTVVDGSRVPPFRADVGIRRGRVADIGNLRRESAATELDAGGMVVAPGFVDLHTHFDAQIQWDPYCTISGWHGVTSIALGNCGFGFAPVRPEHRERAMLMMSRNEAIPVAAQKAGMLWDWVTFPEWLDTLERIPKGVNCLSYVGLNPVIAWAMGGFEEAKHRPMTEGERREMQRVLAESMDAGACGWSTQRLGARSIQSDYDGTPMPSDLMNDDDVLAAAQVLRERGEGLVQLTQATAGEVFGQDISDNPDIKFVERLATETGGPVLFNAVVALDEAPEAHRDSLRWLERCNARGLRMFGQGQNARFRFTFSLREDWNFYDSSPAWRYANQGTPQEKLRKFTDPSIRSQMIAEEEDRLKIGLGGPIENLTLLSVGGCRDLEPYGGHTLAEIAEKLGKTAVDALLDIVVETGLDAEFVTPTTSSTDPDKVAELMCSNYVVPGISDGGAHTKFFAGGSYTTDFLIWLVREEERIPLEHAHFKLSALPAHIAGFKERGVLRVGAPADVVVYDLSALRLVPEGHLEVVHDFPGGEWRRVQRAEGYRWILVNGVVTFEDGKCTGNTPGRLLRHGAESDNEPAGSAD